MGALLYRVRQFVAAVWPLAPGESAEVSRLSSGERALFFGLSPAYRRHSLRVVARLRAGGVADADLLAAALLHDVGKSAARILIYHRVLGVLLGRLLPGVHRRLAANYSAGWSRPFYVQANHARLGADLLRAAGTRDNVVRLVARHHATPSADDPPGLAALRHADSKE